jgi:hypothetical protein
MIRTEMLEVMREENRNRMMKEEKTSPLGQTRISRFRDWWKESREKDRKRTWTPHAL